MRLLHVGCGPKTKAATTDAYNTAEREGVRFDIDEAVNPDLIGTMTDMNHRVVQQKRHLFFA